MRKTYPTSSRSGSAVRELEIGEFPQDERPARSRQRQPQRLSRFDDFDEESLAFQDADTPVRRLPRDSSKKPLTKLQWMLRTRAGRWTLGCSVMVALLLCVAAALRVRAFVRSDPRFRVAGPEQIQVDGNQQVTRDVVRGIFDEDLGRNLFLIPLEARQKQLESLAWVEHASVQRLWPNRIRVRVAEREPAAFAQNGDRVDLIDRHGALLGTPSGVAARQYSFPVLGGMGDDVAASTRAARMSAYLAFAKEIDAHGEKVTSRMSEVDLSDPEDMQALLVEGDRAITVHFGDEKYFDRYKMYQAHLAEWEQQYPKLARVDLRNLPQVVLGMSDDAAVQTPTRPAPVAVAAAVAAEAPVKPMARPAAKAPAKLLPIAAGAGTSATVAASRQRAAGTQPAAVAKRAVAARTPASRPARSSAQSPANRATATGLPQAGPPAAQTGAAAPPVHAKLTLRVPATTPRTQTLPRPPQGGQ